MMNSYIKNLLDKCNQAYSNGEFYTITEDDVYMLDSILDIVVNKEEVSDNMYDIIYNTAKEKWPTDPYFDKLTSDNTGYGIDVIHEIPMGSMEELKEGELVKWVKGHDTFTISDKLDGCSLVLTYEYGKLKVAATRGHGTKGKDITRHINFVSNVPQEIKYNDKIIVRGELLFEKNNIESIMDQVELLTGKRPRNGRNTIAGLLTRKESYEDLLKQTHFVAYWTSTDFGRSFKVLENLGFTVPYNTIKSSEELNDDNMIELVKERIKTSNYELDGIIITQNDNIEEGFVGSTINPKCSRKFKLGIYDNIAESTVTNVNWQISRWGVFTPVLEIEPTEVAGCTVTNITGHNYENIVKLKCGIGSKIKFKRAGLVIPKLEEVLTESEDFNLPKCKTYVEGADLIYLPDDPYMKEPDDIDFQCQHEVDVRALEAFGERLEIEQLGYGNCVKIFDSILIADDVVIRPVDLFALSKEFFIKVIGKNGEKIYDSLQSKKTSITEIDLAVATGAFGPNIGDRALQTVWDKYNRLYDLTKEDFMSLDGFGEARATQCDEYQEQYRSTKETAKDYGVVFTNNIEEKTSDDLEGIVVCFTGVRDKDFAAFINNNGGTALDNWRKDVTHLIVKDINSTSSKMKKAQEKGCVILTLEDAHKEFGYE